MKTTTLTQARLVEIGQNSNENLDSVLALIVVTCWIWQESETKLCQRHNGCNAQVEENNDQKFIKRTKITRYSNPTVTTLRRSGCSTKEAGK